MSEADLRAEFEATWAELGHYERHTLVILAKRILFGQRKYGKLDPNDGRDWDEEREQEFEDEIVYTGFKAIARRFARKP